MDYACLLVHVQESAQRESVVDAALDLSTTFEAHLTALHVYVPGYCGYVGYGAYPYIPDPQAVQREQEAAVELDIKLKIDFEERAQRVRQPNIEWRFEPGAFAETHVVETLAHHARSADLVIMGQHDPRDEDSQVSYDTPALVALTSARPTLVLPYAGHVPSIGNHIVLAWDASREAVRAVTAALPLFARAETVDVVIVDGDKTVASRHGAEPGADIALYLARYGIDASVSRLSRDGLSVSEVLLSKVAENGADLLCMGVYGHSRMREMAFGGTTFDLLRHMTVPTLLAG